MRTRRPSLAGSIPGVHKCYAVLPYESGVNALGGPRVEVIMRHLHLPANMRVALEHSLQTGKPMNALAAIVWV